MNIYYVVYQITNIVNGKFYIGLHKTNNIKDSYMGSGIAISAAIRKYGKENFIKHILYVFDNLEDASVKEKELVTEELLSNPLCYNLKTGGIDSCIYSQETRQKISEIKKEQYKNDPLLREKAKTMKGRRHSDQTKEKMSKSRTGRKISKESIEKRHKTMLEKYGQLSRQTPESIKKILETRKKNGILKSKESIEKMLETKRRNGTDGTGKKLSPESIAKRTASRRANREKLSADRARGATPS